MKVSVIGSGSWGTALALLLLGNGHQVSMWCHSGEKAELLSSTLANPRLEGVALPPELSITASLNTAAKAELLVMATPSYAVREVAAELGPCLQGGASLVCVSKGIERGTGLRLTQVISEGTGKPCAALLGPSHAEEVARREPTGCVAAAEEEELSYLVQDAFMSDRFRVYSSTDVVGVELGGALKNIIALAAGICDGMGCGDNAKALLMTRGLKEIARLGVALGARSETFSGLSGVGDLIVTCTSRHSRNNRCGRYIGQGLSPKLALEKVGAVVEGYFAALAALELSAKAGVEMPITTEVYRILYQNKAPQTVLDDLMTRGKRHENESYWL